MEPQTQTLPGTQHWPGLLLLAPAGNTDFRVLRDVSDAHYVLFPLLPNAESFRHSGVVWGSGFRTLSYEILAR